RNRFIAGGDGRFLVFCDLHGGLGLRPERRHDSLSGRNGWSERRGKVDGVPLRRQDDGSEEGALRVASGQLFSRGSGVQAAGRTLLQRGQVQGGGIQSRGQAWPAQPASRLVGTAAVG